MLKCPLKVCQKSFNIFFYKKINFTGKKNLFLDEFNDEIFIKQFYKEKKMKSKKVKKQKKVIYLFVKIALLAVLVLGCPLDEIGRAHV